MKKTFRGILLTLLLSHTLFCAFAQEDLQEINFGKYRVLKSEILDQERILYVNLPANYENSTEAYPVVFQLYSHFMENYYLPAVRTTSIMGGSSLAPEMIVVGIMNREFRYRDLLPEGHWGGESKIDNFLSFFEKELIPFIESEYRTSDFRILSRPQAGGAFGLYALSEKPDLFDAFFLTSPFWVKSSRETIFNKFSESVNRIDLTNKFLMLTYGKYESGEELEYIQKFEKLANAISNESFTFLSNKIEPNFGFSSPVDFEKGMKTLFHDYPFPQSDQPQKLEAIEKHFQMLSDKLGYPVKITEHALVFEGDKFNRIKDYENALVLFQRMHELYPEGLMGFDRLGGIYRNLGELDKSIKYYEMFLEKQPDNPRFVNLIKEIKEEQKNK